MVHCHCTVSLYTVTVHCHCTLSMYTVNVVTLFCHCTWYTVFWHCTLSLYTCGTPQLHTRNTPTRYTHHHGCVHHALKLWLHNGPWESHY